MPAIGQYFHAYNKGVDGKLIFNDDEDSKIFVSFLKEYVSPPVDSQTRKKEFSIKGKTYRGTPHLPKNYYKEIELVDYNILPDHFHLILLQTTPRSMEKLIRSLCTRYSMYFNKKYHRNGALFQGPYKSVEIKDKNNLDLLKKFIKNHSQNFSTEEKSILKDLAIENLKLKSEKIVADIPLERIPVAHNLTSNLTSHEKSAKPIKRIPEFVGVITIFFLLVTLGINNINSFTTTVLGDTTSVEVISTPVSTQTPEPIVAITTSIAEATPSLGPSPSPEISPTPEPIKEVKNLIIAITDNSPEINIRKEPSLYAEIVGKAVEGQAFEYITVKSGWFQVILDDGTGYISSKYIKKVNN